jgi:hypothetical protein
VGRVQHRAQFAKIISDRARDQRSSKMKSAGRYCDFLDHISIPPWRSCRI